MLYDMTMQVPGTKTSPNTAQYNKSEELNELLNGLMHEMDPEKRCAAVYEAQNVYARELPAISLYYPTWYYAYNPDAGVEWFYTTGGTAKGIPIPQNKFALLGDGAMSGETAEIAEATATETGTAAQATPIAPGLSVIAILIAFAIVQRKRPNRKP
jgi:peptide/nickel transport system substrate-binding protein